MKPAAAGSIGHRGGLSARRPGGRAVIVEPDTSVGGSACTHHAGTALIAPGPSTDGEVDRYLAGRDRLHVRLPALVCTWAIRGRRTALPHTGR